VCLLHSDLNPQHERVLGKKLARLGVDVSLSCDISPEFREYERTVTTIVNAYLRPVCNEYLRGWHQPCRCVRDDVGRRLDPCLGRRRAPRGLVVVGSAGGWPRGRRRAANGFPDAISFDMGGTSTDVCLILDGRPEPAAGETSPASP
jgi:N-methylhydantoinase A/oxoprolinase/acetone carboxylase beta subunit